MGNPQSVKDALADAETLRYANVRPLIVTHFAKSDRRCYHCGGAIFAGEPFRLYRERATSSREAQHGGPYPARHQCVRCIARAAFRAVPGLRG